MENQFIDSYTEKTKKKRIEKEKEKKKEKKGGEVNYLFSKKE